MSILWPLLLSLAPGALFGLICAGAWRRPRALDGLASQCPRCHAGLPGCACTIPCDSLLCEAPRFETEAPGA